MMHAPHLTARSTIARRLVMVAAAMVLLLPGCVLSKNPRSDRDPYVIDSSSDPKIHAGNPY